MKKSNYLIIVLSIILLGCSSNSQKKPQYLQTAQKFFDAHSDDYSKDGITNIKAVKVDTIQPISSKRYYGFKLSSIIKKTKNLKQEIDILKAGGGDDPSVKTMIENETNKFLKLADKVTEQNQLVQKSSNTDTLRYLVNIKVEVTKNDGSVNKEKKFPLIFYKDGNIDASIMED